MEAFRTMWQELGMNLELHDQLLENLGNLHAKTHLSQKNRPKTMARFDHSFHASHANRVAEIREYRKNGGKSIGTFCIYIPDEIALAAGVLPIPLCGGSSWSVNYADKMFPRDICPLVRSTFGMAFSGTCPYKTLKDFAVGETTCDAKKKAWDLLGFKGMEVPQRKNPTDKQLWLNEVYQFKDMMETLSGIQITPQKLHENIKRVNRKRRALQRINEFRKLPQPPISGLDALLVSQVALNQDIDQFIIDAEMLAAELEERVRAGISAYAGNGKRVLLAGSPSPMGNAKVHHIVESAGLRIVADESCTGLRYYRDLVDETPTDLDGMMRAIADRYFAIDCSCFSPNQERIENIKMIINDYQVQGVVHNILQYCHTYNIEAAVIDKTLQQIGIPSIKIETDYSQEDVGQLKTRVEAFAEVIAMA
ncbi:MAG: double-cubane-cluster-containing anaerobic reductase [candidate division KSB1 bacterium]|nr:double-cubane-cluster-containing anaerobic reductase [candidate division KSB1 bacterium]MDZ7317891.1 double-cubane-cluster-containing anaerobic reductase [candidate division KSB1 bacterium]MDZ7341737.1 double-cubane-cluster-containing anaerobic reductase [candidate division KSB1 bacterium]